MLSASQLDRANQCPGSESLPSIGRITKDNRRGVAIHAFVQAVQEKGRDTALGEAPEEFRGVCEAIDTSVFDGLDLASEVAYAWEPFSGTAREIGRGIERNYEGKIAPGEIPGTADLVGIDAEGDGVLVLDIKTGAQYLPSPEQSWQLRFLALCAARAYGKHYARIGFVPIHHDGKAEWHVTEIGPADLEAFEAELDELLLRVGAATANDLVEGPACTYCGAFSVCPSKARLLNALAASNENDAIKAMSVATSGPITNETAAVAWARVNLILKAAERVKENLRDWAKQHPIDLGDGSVVCAKETEEESFLPIAVEQVMQDLQYSSVVVGKAVTLRTSKSAIREAIKEVAPRGTLAARVRAVEDEIRKRGGARMTTSVEVRAWRKQGPTKGEPQ